MTVHQAPKIPHHRPKDFLGRTLVVHYRHPEESEMELGNLEKDYHQDLILDPIKRQVGMVLSGVLQILPGSRAISCRNQPGLVQVALLAI
jgi:hypothetical protein